VEIVPGAEESAEQGDETDSNEDPSSTGASTGTTPTDGEVPTGGGGAGGGVIAGTGGSGGAGGSMGPPASETCPGETIQLSAGDDITIQGSTTSLADDQTVWCSSTPASDAVYHVEIMTPCTLTVSLADSAGLDAILGLRRGQCDADVGGDQCFDVGSDDEWFASSENEGGFWLVVEGADGTTGDYSLRLQCAAPFCGDLIVNAGEECDLGLDDPDDTCSDTCQDVGADAAESCATVEAPFPLAAGLTVLPDEGVWFTNAGASHDSIGSCAYAGEVNGKDEVFAFSPDVSGTLTISTGLDALGNPVCTTFTEPECWYSFLYVREATCDTGTEVACAEIDLGTGITTTSFSVVAGQTYYLFVDGLNDQFYSYGPYTLHFDLQ
jgi:hypothetical protein